MPLGGKGKSKAKEGRQSRSRNSTPLHTPTSAASNAYANAPAGYLELNYNQLMIPTNIMYDEILERHSGSGSGGIPDPRHLETLKNDLSTLSQLAANREKTCDAGMRELHSRIKIRQGEERAEQAASRESEERIGRLKRAARDDDMDEDGHQRSSSKAKTKKRKERSRARDEARPLAVGAHGVAKQDGADTSPNERRHRESVGSGSSSSLSPAQSPTAAEAAQKPAERTSRAGSEEGSSSEDEHQPKKASSVPQYQTFGPNPLVFDDPTIYHVRDVTPDMDDELKKEIYNVAVFPKSDLRDQVAGQPPDKDFSNAKPSNQVNANTFATYLEQYLRPFADEDIAFLKERGDHITPFLMPRRATKHYRQIWAEEDGHSTSDNQHDKYPPNQARGSMDQMDDDVAETDKVSAGPVLSRLLSTLRYEHRPEEKDRVNGVLTNGDHAALNGDPTDAAGGLNADASGSGSNEPPRPPAAQLPESTNPAWKTAPQPPKLDYAAMDERLKAELRYIGFMGADDEPDYDAHADDEIAQRLRLWQAELKKVMIENGARKARVLQLVEEQMGHQEYAQIRDDLDQQVNQAFTKRNRTLGKGKKNAKRPGGAGGGAGGLGPAGAAGVTRPGIGDQAKVILERRRKWMDTIGPVFSPDVLKVRTEGESIFTDDVMEPLRQAERERIEEGEVE